MILFVEAKRNTGELAHSSTIFAQLLKLAPRHEFEGLAEAHKPCHLGPRGSRSLLARVHAEKPLELFHALFGRLPPRCRSVSPGHWFRFKAKLLPPDSTVVEQMPVDVSAGGVPWTNGWLKAHVALDHQMDCGFTPPARPCFLPHAPCDAARSPDRCSRGGPKGRS